MSQSATVKEMTTMSLRDEPSKESPDLSADALEATRAKWTLESEYVVRALRFIKGFGSAAFQAEELVAWDAAHERRLFTWDDNEAAEKHRVHEARMFLNYFRGKVDAMQVRMIAISIPGDEEAGIVKGYRNVEAIAQDDVLSEIVKNDYLKRIQRLRRDMTFWSFDDATRLEILKELNAWAADISGPKKR